jgi:predicted RNA polymerase sigma factor
LRRRRRKKPVPAAVERCPVSGVPAFPRVWIIQTAQQKAIDPVADVAPHLGDGP